jgi:hypothetical protein
LGRQVDGPVDLDLVDAHADHLAPDEPGHLARRPADAATDVQHLHAGLEADPVGQSVLVEALGRVDSVVGPERGEVEVPPPASLKGRRDKVVVSVVVVDGPRASVKNVF